MYKKFVAIAVLGICLLGETAVALGEETIKIGVAVPLTGANAEYGKDIQNGVSLAIEEANQQNISLGGKPTRFVMESVDDQADPRVGVQVAQRLIDDAVSVVIGHFNSGTTIPASKLYSAAGIPMITPSASNPAITTQGSNTVFSVIASDAQNAGRAALYAVRDLKAQRIAIMDDETAFGQGAADEFQKAVKAHNGNIVDRQFTSDKAVDFSAQLTHIKDAKADLLFFSGLNPQAAMVAKRMKALGMKTQFVGGGGVVSDTFVTVAGPAAEGAMACEYGSPLADLPKGIAFEKKYQDKFGGTMLPYAAFAYDATWMSIKAMQAANSAKDQVFVPKLHSLTYPGVTGEIQFSAQGALKNPTSTMYTVKDGKWVPVVAAK